MHCFLWLSNIHHCVYIPQLPNSGLLIWIKKSVNIQIYSSVDGHLDCIHVLAVVNSAGMNIGVRVSFSVFVSSGCMPRSGIAGSYGGFAPGF